MHILSLCFAILLLLFYLIFRCFYNFLAIFDHSSPISPTTHFTPFYISHNMFVFDYTSLFLLPSLSNKTSLPPSLPLSLSARIYAYACTHWPTIHFAHFQPLPHFHLITSDVLKLLLLLSCSFSSFCFLLSLSFLSLSAYAQPPIIFPNIIPTLVFSMFPISQHAYTTFPIITFTLFPLFPLLTYYPPLLSS